MICVSIRDTDFEGTIKSLETPEADMAELRLDLSQYTLEEIRCLCSMPFPIIATCRCAEAGEGKTEKQLSAAIEAGAYLVDLELEMPRSLSGRLLRLARQAGCGIIISYHCFERTPDIVSLRTIVRDCLSRGADIVKVATAALFPEDPQRVLSLYSDPVASSLKGRLVAFAMGEAGRQSRLDSLRLGAPFTYACADGRPTAPGQPSVSELRMALYGSGPLPCRYDGKVDIPQSKSTLQRRIVASALAGEACPIDEKDVCDDIEAARRAASLIIDEKMKATNGFEK